MVAFEAQGAEPKPALAPDAKVASLREAAVAAIAVARARVAAGSEILREVTLPSIERLLEDADLRRGSVTVPARDWDFVRKTLETARAYADRVAAGEDPYRSATGEMVKAYRADWDGTLQPYALYVPRGYDPRKPWPLVVALHGALSDHRHNLRRVFGLDNRPGETDAEASRNELPLPDVSALVVSPYGRGELMGYDGLGGEDVMRVLGDVRRAYHVDPERITLTGPSMGGGGTWQIGLRHPELFAALAPVCGISDYRRMIRPADAALYDLPLLVGAAPLNALTRDLPVPLSDASPLGDRAYRAVVPDPRAPGRFALVLGALTPHGLARLHRFVHLNRDAWAPEPNRPFALLAE